MKSFITSLLRTVALAVTVSCLTTAASAKDSNPTDRAAQLLQANGSVPIASGNFFVERGSWPSNVLARFGQPSVRLPDGTWLYHNLGVENSGARGTLIVEFKQGRVSDLTLVTPTIAAEIAAQRRTPSSTFVARH